MPAPQYTSCVKPQDFDPAGFDPKYFGWEIGFALWSFVMFGIPGLFGTAVAAMAALHKVCQFLLHGKLVCLNRSGCAIGRVVSFETVDDKSGFDKIDNDFSFNIVLAPHGLEFFANGAFPNDDFQAEFVRRYDQATKAGQGWLITEQPGMPMPVEPKNGRRFYPTFTEYPDRNNLDYARAPTGTNTTTSGPRPYRVPVLHCEIEGERAYKVCDALDLPMHVLGTSKLCRWKPLGIPIGRFLCAVASLAFAPIVAIAVLIAWVAGSDDNRDFAGAGRLYPGEEIIVKGRWVYDSAHEGWNEIHPVTCVQRTSELGPSRNLDELHAIWCRGIDRSPPNIGVVKTGLTSEQQEVYEAQCLPENRWHLHPAVDGCRRAER